MPTGRPAHYPTKREQAAQAKRNAQFIKQWNEEIQAGMLRRATAVGVVIAKLGIPERVDESKGLTFPTKLFYTVEGVSVVVEVNS